MSDPTRLHWVLISYRNPHDQASVRRRSTCHIAPPLLSNINLQNEAYCWFSLRLPGDYNDHVMKEVASAVVLHPINLRGMVSEGQCWREWYG